MEKVKEHIYVKFKQESVSRKEEGRGEDLGLEALCTGFLGASLERGTFGWEEAGVCS